MLRWNFRPMAVYQLIAPSTFRWFWLPTGHAPATLPCDAVEPPTTRQIGDSPTFNRIVIGVWSVGYRKHCTLISGSSADDRSGSGQNLYERGGSDQMSAVTPMIILPPTYQWRISLFSHGQVSCVSCYLPVIVRHYSDELRWSPDENVLPVSHQCLVTIGLPTGCTDHTPASNVPALYLRDKLKCVRPISDEIGRKWKIHFPTSFRPATGLCGRGALQHGETESNVWNTFCMKLPYVAQQVGNAYFYRLTEIKELSGSLWWMHEGSNLLRPVAGCGLFWHVGLTGVLRH